MNFESTRTLYAVKIYEVASQAGDDGHTYSDHSADGPLADTLAGYDTPEEATDDALAEYDDGDHHIGQPYPYQAFVEYVSTIGRQGLGGQGTYTPDQMQAIYEDSELEQSGYTREVHEVVYEVIDDPHFDYYPETPPLFYRYGDTWYDIPQAFATMTLDLVDEDE